MDERKFPIQTERGAKPHPLLIPWSMAELAYSGYAANYGKSQSLERLAERGGFGPSEMDEYLPDWRERCDELQRLRAELKDMASRCQCLLTCLNVGNIASESPIHLELREAMIAYRERQ